MRLHFTFVVNFATGRLVTSTANRSPEILRNFIRTSMSSAPIKTPSCVIGDTVYLPGGITSVDRTFTFPLDWRKAYESNSETIEVFAREIFDVRKVEVASLPYILYLQGGPGFQSPRFGGGGGWIGYALNFYRVILLDQRGTGKSTPVTSASLSCKGTPEEQARYLEHFRSDSIVNDCEAIRIYFEQRQNSSESAARPLQWTLLGQSYGGFCITTYLSFYPKSVKSAFFTGGLPPLRDIDDVYKATYRRLAVRNKRYYQRYPLDIIKVRDIVRFIAQSPNGEVQLPRGGKLTPRRFLQIGLRLGMKGGFEYIHYLIDEAWEQNKPNSAFSYIFLSGVEDSLGFETNPLYALLHESIYIYDESGKSSNWSAHRMMMEERDSIDRRFQWEDVLKEDDSAPLYFTGEMVYPWMFDGDYSLLHPYKEVAHILAQKNNWRKLYDEQKLRECQVQCAAVIYYDDMYVEKEFSEEVAAMLPHCKVWITNEYQHSGLRDDGENILKKLHGMIRDEVIIPS